MRLITKTDIADFREVSRGVRNDKINPYIDDAQFIDLRPQLGDRFYNDIISNSTNPEYTELIEGGQYQHAGVQYTNPGLKKVLAIYAYARYVVFGSYTDTAFGFVEKSHQDSKPVSDASKRNIHKQEQNTAFNYWLEVAKYLDRNADKYPLWKKSNCEPRKSGGFRISKIV